MTRRSYGSGTRHDYATIKYSSHIEIKIDINPGSDPNSKIYEILYPGNLPQHLEDGIHSFTPVLMDLGFLLRIVSNSVSRMLIPLIQPKFRY